MSRRRYISTDISTDIKTAELAEHGILPLLLYTWAIPHMDDWGRMSGDARQFKLTVCPALDVSSKEVDEALNQIAKVGLWDRYEADGKNVIAIPEDNWFKHQSYIPAAKRGDDTKSNYPKIPQNTEDHRESPQNPVSFSLSPSFSSSPSESSSSVMGHNAFALYQKHEFGKLDEISSQFIGESIDEHGEDWVKRAIIEAVKGNKKNWSYVNGILKRWKTTGHSEPWTLEKEQTKQQSVNSNYGKQQRPKLPVVKDEGPARVLTQEEREAARELARRMKGESA